jgi:uncharacterized membrane protein YvlD (DUF360 family)
LVAVWIIQALALWAIARLVPGITIVGTASDPGLIVAVSFALVLGRINVLARPILLLLTLGSCAISCCDCGLPSQTSA